MLNSSNHTYRYQHVVLILVLINIFVLKMGFLKDKQWYILLFFLVPALIYAVYKNNKSPMKNHYVGNDDRG